MMTYYVQREKMVHYKSMYYKQLRSQANLITQSEWLELSDESKADMMEVPPLDLFWRGWGILLMLSLMYQYDY